MSNFVIKENGIVLNRTAAAEGRVAIAAWDIGSSSDTTFLSTQPAQEQQSVLRQQDAQSLQGKWILSVGRQDNQVLVCVREVAVGQVNRRAAAILAPLLQADLIEAEFQENQQPDGRAGKALYVYAKVGVDGNTQVVREPATTREARAYVALLACSMKALKAADQHPDRDAAESDGEGDGEADDLAAASWRKLPGVLRWDCATGGIGNTVNLDLIDQLGSRTLAVLRQSGAPVVGRDRTQPTLPVAGC